MNAAYRHLDSNLLAEIDAENNAKDAYILHLKQQEDEQRLKERENKNKEIEEEELNKKYRSISWSIPSEKSWALLMYASDFGQFNYDMVYKQYAYIKGVLISYYDMQQSANQLKLYGAITEEKEGVFEITPIGRIFLNDPSKPGKEKRDSFIHKSYKIHEYRGQTHNSGFYYIVHYGCYCSECFSPRKLIKQRKAEAQGKGDFEPCVVIQTQEIVLMVLAFLVLLIPVLLMFIIENSV